MERQIDSKVARALLLSMTFSFPRRAPFPSSHTLHQNTICTFTPSLFSDHFLRNIWSL